MGTLAVLTWLAGGTSLSADPITAGSLLISETNGGADGIIFEYSRTGTLLQTFHVPPAPGGDSGVQSIVLDGDGRIEVYNGTFSPYLTTVTPSAGPGNATYENHAFPDSGAIGNVPSGGLAYDSTHNVIYATDPVINNTDSIIRFDLNNNFAASRIAQGSGAPEHGAYTELAFGGDGLLYAVYPPGGAGQDKIDVIDPVTGNVLRTVGLTTNSIDGIAVDAAGDIFTTNMGSGVISRYNAAGTITGSLDTGFGSLHGLVLSDDGMLATQTDYGLNNDSTVVLTTTDLTTPIAFAGGSTGKSQSFLTFATVPEPSPVVLLGLGLSGVGFGRWLVRFRTKGGADQPLRS
jgi:hypothetical protein